MTKKVPKMKVVNGTIIMEKGKPGNYAGSGSGNKSMVLRRTIETANRIASESKLLPLDVMIDNMTFYHTEAKAMQERVRELIGQGSPEDEDGVSIETLFDDMLTMRGRAEDCACDCAPYLHPKLAAVMHKGEGNKVEVIRRVIIDTRHTDA